MCCICITVHGEATEATFIEVANNKTAIHNTREQVAYWCSYHNGSHKVS